MSRRPRPVLDVWAVIPCQYGAGHRVGVTPPRRVGGRERGGRQLVMADHDRRAERAAAGLDPTLSPTCVVAYDLLVREVRRDPAEASRFDQSPLVDYLAARRKVGQAREARRTHDSQLAGTSILAADSRPLLGRVPHRLATRGELDRAKRAARERLVPGLFLACDYPFVRTHPQASPDHPRGACWHVQLAEPSVREPINVPIKPHPDGHRMCFSVTIPVDETWYPAIYRQGMAVVDGQLCVGTLWSPRHDPGAHFRGRWVTLLVQRGGRFALEDAAVELDPDEGRWHLVPGETGARPDPW